jgi:hypothetical protein
MACTPGSGRGGTRLHRASYPIAPLGKQSEYMFKHVRAESQPFARQQAQWPLSMPA